MKQRTKKEYAQLIVETVEYYGENPRGVTILNDGPSDCVYYCEKTKVKCAVGRCMTDDAAVVHTTYATSVDNLPQVTRCGVDAILKEEYHGYQVSLWRGLQSLHDWDKNWRYDSGLQKTVLTSAGEVNLRELLKVFSLQDLVDVQLGTAKLTDVEDDSIPTLVTPTQCVRNMDNR